MKTAIGLTLILGTVLFNTLPTGLALIALCVLAGLGGLLVGGYWYETAIRVQAELFAMTADRDKHRSDAFDLARRLDNLVGRFAELVDENQLMRDEFIDAPIPFTIISPPDATLPRPLHLVVPPQRTAGDAS